MSEFTDVFEAVLESGLEGAGICLLLVITYKIYRMKIHTSSSCCEDAFSLETHNPGSGDDSDTLDVTMHPPSGV